MTRRKLLVPQASSRHRARPVLRAERSRQPHLEHDVWGRPVRRDRRPSHSLDRTSRPLGTRRPVGRRAQSLRAGGNSLIPLSF